MRAIIFTISLLIITTLSLAQNKKQNRLLEDGEMIIYGFAKVDAGLSFSTDNLCIDGTIAGAATLNQTYFLGGFYSGNLNRLPHAIEYEVKAGNNEVQFVTEDDGDVTFNYGGIYAGYIYSSNFPLHAAASLQLGWGNAKLYDPFNREVFSDGIMVIHPQIEGFYRFNSWFKMSVSLGYRFVTGYEPIEGYGLSSSDHNSPTLRIGFVCGWFDLK
tara:strand:+ start:2262 stop:2906 length:645 start_codon:yes stop_codon:yes gene_type:complete